MSVTPYTIGTELAPTIPANPLERFTSDPLTCIVVHNQSQGLRSEPSELMP